MKQTNRLLAFAIGAIVAGVHAGSGAATAGEVTLRVKGGGLEISGELKSFDGLMYVIEAPSVGTMSFDSSRFECLGENCNRRVTLSGLPGERLSADAPDRFQVRGPGQISYALMPALIRGYAASQGVTATQILGTATGEARFRLADAGGAELATISVQSDAASGAFEALRQGQASISASDRPISDAEAQNFARGGGDLRSAQTQHIVGQDGLALVVSPENPIASLSEDSIAKIFAGEITGWTETGAPGGRIAIYSAGPRSSAEDVLAEAFLKPRGLSRAAVARELVSEADVADAVARDPNGIGIVSFSAQRSAKRLNIEGTCGLITRPTSFAVKAGEYPLSRKLYLYTGGVLSQPAARGLLRYALSHDAQSSIAGQELIDERIEFLSFEEQTERMAYALNVPAQSFDMTEMRKLLADLKGSRRLSMTFRFSSGAFELDQASRLDILRLVELMQSTELSGKTVMLVGFTDGEGRFAPNAAIAARRASQVRTAVLAAADGRIAPTAIVAKGYGPLAPIACNDTLERRQLNRRVEVWVKDRL